MLFFARLHRSPSRFTPFVGIKVRLRYIHTTRAVWQDRLDSLKVEHSNFLSSASSDTKWKDDDGNGVIDNTEAEMKELKEGEGKLLPTSSHLFKLILPIDKIRADWSTNTYTDAETNHPPRRSGSVPTVLLLHPSQPLSHLSRLILASLSRQTHPESLEINFKSSPASGTSPQYATQFQWSDSTDIGDFIRDAASAAEFLICVTRESEEGESSNTTRTAQGKETVIPVRVPTFADRTRFLRRRLDVIDAELSTMEGLKRQCEMEAQRGARRMALGGFGMLVVYWAAVARLTFWDYGWDVMEPITYLSGLSSVVCGYLWFLYQGREVSYSSVLHRSVSARRQALYKSKGLDIDRWEDLVHERKALLREIGRIKEDYDHGKSQQEKETEKESRDSEGEDSF